MEAGSGSFGDVVYINDKHVEKTYRNVPSSVDAIVCFIKETSVLSFIKTSQLPMGIKLIDVKQNKIKMNAMETNLYEFMNYAKQERIKYISKILHQVHSIHKCGILHRDIKPANILVNPAKEKLILCDYGSAYVYMNHQVESHHISFLKTSGYTTKIYLHPELMRLKKGYYMCELDAWSVMMIWAQMLDISLWRNLYNTNHSDEKIIEFYDTFLLSDIGKEMREKHVPEDEITAFCDVFTTLLHIDFDEKNRDVIHIYDIYHHNIFKRSVSPPLYSSPYFKF